MFWADLLQESSLFFNEEKIVDSLTWHLTKIFRNAYYK